MSSLLPTLAMVLSLLNEAPADAQAVVSASNQLALDLYAQLHNEGANLFFSPYSISKTLAMTYAGARGETAREMAAVLHFTLGQERQHRAFLALRQVLNQPDRKDTFKPPVWKPSGDEMYLSANLWGHRGFRFRKEFLAQLQECYGAGLEETDFSSPEQARQKINTWAEGQTNRTIKNLFPEGSLDSTTRLVLASAMYYKGRWASPFEKRDTTTKLFHCPGKAPLPVPMMKQTATFGYSQDEQVQALRLPYEGEKRALFVLLPREADGLAKLEKTLTADRLAALLAGIHHEEVEVYLPRFRMTDQFELKNTLAALGMRLAFSKDAADFSGMNEGPERLYVSVVTHKAFVDVSEEGTEAAAATGVGMALAGASPIQPPPPPVFRADHPFLFAICDVRTGLILFLGRVMKP